MEAARRSLAFCSGRSRSAADNTNRIKRAACDNPQTRNGQGERLEEAGPKINNFMTEEKNGSVKKKKTKRMKYADAIFDEGVRK